MACRSTHYDVAKRHTAPRLFRIQYDNTSQVVFQGTLGDFGVTSRGIVGEKYMIAKAFSIRLRNRLPHLVGFMSSRCQPYVFCWPQLSRDDVRKQGVWHDTYRSRRKYSRKMV